MNFVGPQDIEIDIVEEEKRPKIFFPPSLIMKPKKKVKDLILERKAILESEFESLFRMVTTSLEYKSKMFYQRVKVIIEATRILVYEYSMKSTNTLSEKYYPLVVLDFNQVSAGVKVKPKSKKFCILVLGSDKKFKFRTSSQEIYENTLLHLNYYIENSLGAKSNLFGVSLRKDFYKHYYMFENEFKNKAKTGDLLIFRGFECPAKCQRCFTSAHYDHIALLYRKNDILFVYESTAKDGCMVRSWREFTQFLWNLLYDKMVYRELIVNMEEQQKTKYIEELEENCEYFIKETQRKKYKLSCSAICCASKNDYEKNNEWDKSEGFFCSQLVAAAYLKFNILKYTKGTGNYLPGSFSHGQAIDLHLNENFALGPEIIIEFSS